jgi:hypothetical protein
VSVSFRKLATLDFEASGLNGWPIEIGWMREDDAEPTSFLIRPRPEFDRTRWSPNAEKLHGISLARIEREGVPASEIVPEFIAALDGHILVSDNPSFERRSPRCRTSSACAPPSKCAPRRRRYRCMRPSPASTRRSNHSDRRRTGPALTARVCSKRCYPFAHGRFPDMLPKREFEALRFLP